MVLCFTHMETCFMTVQLLNEFMSMLYFWTYSMKSNRSPCHHHWHSLVQILSSTFSCLTHSIDNRPFSLLSVAVEWSSPFSLSLRAHGRSASTSSLHSFMHNGFYNTLSKLTSYRPLTLQILNQDVQYKLTAVTSTILCCATYPLINW
jgi:hypothetical protein